MTVDVIAAVVHLYSHSQAMGNAWDYNNRGRMTLTLPPDIEIDRRSSGRTGCLNPSDMSCDSLTGRLRADKENLLDVCLSH